ncbi:Pyridoxamine 5'-phosphate oxidase [Rubripirellula lacrimiformis]|uniref:Pyridoxamine 5'-phosphate oxidase n=1 Tax=Rubripirellula lacrimiformis TaxID=1930273 RepID=A0A517NKC2_9BACT|nr:pyridoxamine 5'-phosphate oxidase family protein [Rubripirellula lacrimiformis]QDT07591.1 Pyridoxamine 5'-phosphate oxidase [Rubripirellula lacrimiformis]
MDKNEKLIDLMSDFSTAMLVTRSSDGALDARPMAVAEVEDNGCIWFVTDRNSGKVADLMLDDEVAITMQSSTQFATVSGRAEAVDDQEKVKELWSEAWKVWFPEGKNDPSILLLKIQVERGEYWDQSGFRGVKYLLQAGKAYLQGDRPEKDESINATVNMNN